LVLSVVAAAAVGCTWLLENKSYIINNNNNNNNNNNATACGQKGRTSIRGYIKETSLY
jgi:hypothetical protein